MTLTADLDADVDDSAVTFAFAVSNEGTDPVGFQFPTAQSVEVVVTERGGDTAEASGGGDASAERDGEQPDDPAWRYSEGRAFAQVVTEVILEPGETLTRTVTWSDPSPGEYVATAQLAADADVRAEATFAVYAE